MHAYYNFGARESNLMKLIHVTCCEIHLLGALAPPPKIWLGKNVQNSARFWTTLDLDLEYLRNGWRMEILKIGKASGQLQFVLRSVTTIW